MKGAHADLSSTAWQEIGVKLLFWSLSGITGITGIFPGRPGGFEDK
jgi:hypothetical protein